jgi:hypothetical protein
MTVDEREGDSRRREGGARSPVSSLAPNSLAGATPDESETADVRPSDSTQRSTTRLTDPAGRRARLLLIALSMISFLVCVGTALRTSTTWDEIIFMAAGARGYETGNWELATDHPPVMQYVYGLPVYLSSPNYPDPIEAPSWDTFLSQDRLRRFFVRYDYSRAFFWGVGNNPQKLAMYGRLIAAFLVVCLILTTHAFTARHYGEWPALFGASLVAFMPMVLAQGAVAYSDVPIAFVMLATLWAADRAVRRPAALRGALVGVLAGTAITIKYTALALAPAALLLIGAEAVTRRFDRTWLRALPQAIAAGAVAAYLTMVAAFRGDFTLLEARRAIAYTMGFVDAGRGSSFFLGQEYSELPWFTYPVMFVLRMPAAYHIAVLLAMGGAVIALKRESLRRLLESPLRAPLIGAALVAAATLSTNLPAFRYLLPALTLLAIPIARGVQILSERLRWVPALAAGLVLWYAVETLSIYPHFLAYTSEWAPGRDRIQEAFVDPSVDVGQALFDLRAWMAETGNEYVYLSNQGSNMPAGYGIRYVPLPSAYWIPKVWPEPERRPEYAVVSVTNLFYLFPLNPLAPLRRVEPDTVLGHVLLVYRMDRPEIASLVDGVRRQMELYE